MLARNNDNLKILALALLLAGVGVWLSCSLGPEALEEITGTARTGAESLREAPLSVAPATLLLIGGAGVWGLGRRGKATPRDGQGR